MCAQKLTSSQLNLGDGTKKQENNEKDQKNKYRYAHCTALHYESESPIMCPGVAHAITKFYLPPVCLSTNTISHHAFIKPQSFTALWSVLISRPEKGRRLSWPEKTVTLCPLF